MEGVEGGEVGDGKERRVADVVGGGYVAEGEVADVVGGWGDAVGEDFVELVGSLLDKGDGVAAEAEEAGGGVEETLVVMATTEEEVVDDVGGSNSQCFLSEVSSGEGFVTVRNTVNAS